MDLGEYPLEVQLNWTKDEKEGKFVLRNAAHKPINVQKVTSILPIRVQALKYCSVANDPRSAEKHPKSCEMKWKQSGIGLCALPKHNQNPVTGYRI